MRAAAIFATVSVACTLAVPPNPRSITRFEVGEPGQTDISASIAAELDAADTGEGFDETALVGIAPVAEGAVTATVARHYALSFGVSLGSADAAGVLEFTEPDAAAHVLFVHGLGTGVYIDAEPPLSVVPLIQPEAGLVVRIGRRYGDRGPQGVLGVLTSAGFAPFDDWDVFADTLYVTSGAGIDTHNAVGLGLQLSVSRSWYFNYTGGNWAFVAMVSFRGQGRRGERDDVRPQVDVIEAPFPASGPTNVPTPPPDPKLPAFWVEDGLAPPPKITASSAAAAVAKLLQLERSFVVGTVNTRLAGELRRELLATGAERRRVMLLSPGGDHEAEVTAEAKRLGAQCSWLARQTGQGIELTPFSCP